MGWTPYLGRRIAVGAITASLKAENWTWNVWGGGDVMVVVDEGHVREGGTSPWAMDAVGTAKTGTTDDLVWATEGVEVSVFGFSMMRCRCRVVVFLERQQVSTTMALVQRTTGTHLPRETSPVSKTHLST